LGTASVPAHVKQQIDDAKTEYTKATKKAAPAELYNLTLKQNDNGKHVVKVYPPKDDSLTNADMVALWNDDTRTKPFVVEVETGKFYLVTARDENTQIGYYKRALTAGSHSDALAEVKNLSSRRHESTDQSFTSKELKDNPGISKALQDHIATEIIIKNKHRAVLKTDTDLSVHTLKPRM